ncbi:Na+/H+ antiporter subunit E [Thermochromatium tepidum]|jgi:Multisubunit Na+/H+ antiporter, MnhE subunit|uniref:Na+/H+ antiporter subunit E n=1 Tax=Thermochromatium tepidum ATCC 43061 TaxID=316276 RepID=A0A6I6E181_THETI|nr:Na+/H+ antiporter subunit E [Thermochromatium tepidum]QGU33624.1 Na+/H+ antiporter subunit E [Thermochromatium tepidum ATCC 43061]
MKRWLPHPLLTLLLALIWMVLTNSLTPGSLLLGLGLGWLIPIFTRPFWPDPLPVRRPLTLMRFLILVGYDILVANLAVAWLILRGPRHIRPAFVMVPLELRSELAISLLANMVSLTPGTVSSWLSPDRRILVVQGLNVADPEALVDTIKRRYEAPIREVFEPC